MPKYLLNKQEQKGALQLAELVNGNDDALEIVLTNFRKNTFAADAIMDFWNKYNDRTKLALNKFLGYKCRKHLEGCFELHCQGHPDMEN